MTMASTSGETNIWEYDTFVQSTNAQIDYPIVWLLDYNDANQILVHYN